MKYNRLFWPKRLIYDKSPEKGGGVADFNDAEHSNRIASTEENKVLDTIKVIRNNISALESSEELVKALKRFTPEPKARGASGPGEQPDLPKGVEEIKLEIMSSRDAIYETMENLLNAAQDEELIKKAGEAIIAEVRSDVQQSLKSFAERLKTSIKNNPEMAAIYNEVAPLIESIAEGIDLKVENGKIKIVRIRKTVRIGQANVEGQYSPDYSYARVGMGGNSLTLDSRRQVVFDTEHYGKLTLSPQSVVYHQDIPGNVGGAEAAVGFRGRVEVRGILNAPGGSQVATAYSSNDGTFYLRGNIPVTILGGDALLAVNTYRNRREHGATATLGGVF